MSFGDKNVSDMSAATNDTMQMKQAATKTLTTARS